MKQLQRVILLFFLTEDYDGALGVFTEMAYLAQERGGKQLLKYIHTGIYPQCQSQLQ